MYRLEKEFRFEASHQLPKHSGKCQRLHGHSWRGRVIVEGNELAQEGSSTGMLVDYTDLTAVVAPLIEEKLDHWHLNHTTGLENPTSEELAKWMYNELKPKLPNLVAVKVDETCSCSCEYRP